MANKFAESQKQSAQTPSKPRKSTATKASSLPKAQSSLSTPLALKDATLGNLAVEMDRFAEDFSDEVANVVEDGLVRAIELTEQKVKALGVTDFFTGLVPSLSGGSSPVLSPADQTIDIAAQQLA